MKQRSGGATKARRRGRLERGSDMAAWEQPLNSQMVTQFFSTVFGIGELYNILSNKHLVHTDSLRVLLFGESLVETFTAKGLVNVFFAEDHQFAAFAEAMRVIGKTPAFDADGMHFLHVFGYSHKGRNRTEGFSEIVSVEAGRDDADAAVCQRLADRSQVFSEKLGLVNTNDLHFGTDFKHLGGILDGLAGNTVRIMRNNLHI